MRYINLHSTFTLHLHYNVCFVSIYSVYLFFLHDADVIVTSLWYFICCISRRAGTKNKLGQTNRRRRRRDRDAEGVEGERYGEGVPLPIQLGVWGASWAPCRVRSGAPAQNEFGAFWCPHGRWLQRFTKFCSVSSNGELRKLHKHRQHT